MSEEQAKKKFGDSNIVIYHSKYVPLEQSLTQHFDENTLQPKKQKSYIKLICNK